MRYVKKSLAILLTSSLVFLNIPPVPTLAVTNNAEWGNVTDYGLTASQCVGSSSTKVLSSNTNCVQALTAGTNISITGTASNPVINDTNGTVTATAPTVQRFTSGSGTYTTPAGVVWIRVQLVGAGGGGGGSGTTPGTGGTGGNSTFGGTLLVAGGGAGGTNTGAYPAGGTASSTAGPLIEFSAAGGQGGISPNGAGGTGGTTCLGGAGTGSGNGSAVTGGAGAANSGAGGGGTTGGASSSNGGAAGACMVAIINSPSATYAYAVGASGTGGTAGTGGQTGGAGGSGLVTVEEHYNY